MSKKKEIIKEVVEKKPTMINGKALKEIAEMQKMKYNIHLSNYNDNIKKIGIRAKQDRDRYGIPYAEISAVAGISDTAVSDFLNGKTVPNLVAVSAICGAIKMLKPQFAIKTVQNMGKVEA